MRLAALSLVLVATTACGDVGTAERLSSKETLDGIDVPTIGTVGDFPDPAHRHVVNVTADGRIVMDRATYSRSILVDELKRRGDLDRGERIIGSDRFISGAAVVLRADGALPWGAALDLYVACMRSSIQFVAFAVRHEGDDADGALAVFGMTMGDQDDDMYSVVNVEKATRGVFAVVGGGDGSADAVYATLAASKPSELLGLNVYLDLDPRLPTRTALAILDASLRAGARWGRFVRPGMNEYGAAPEDQRVCRLEDFDAELRRPRVSDPTYALGIAMDDRSRSPIQVIAGTAMPPVARVRGRTAGITWGHDHYGPR